MVWPGLTFLALAGLAVLHFWWRARFREAGEQARREFDRFRGTLEETAQRLRTEQELLLNSMVEGLLLLDQAGRVQLANRAFNELFGVTTDIRSRTILEALRLHELADLVDFLGREKQVLGYELRLGGPPERCLQVNAAAILNAQGQRQGTLLVFHDLTRLKQLERARQEFVANVSHELRTPLSLIKGYVETLLEGANQNPEVATKFLQTIEHNAERLSALMNDLLTISELESGHVRLNLLSVSLAPLVQKVLADFKVRADAKEVKLVGETPDVRVQADPDRLEQVLGNLVDNAIKYGRTAGTVTISARPLNSREIEVRVKDDGPGIPADALGRVFERFYRVDKSRSREQGGTGLGLAIVKHIIQSHGGRAWVESDFGHGASFCFTLPQPGAALVRTAH